MGRRFRPGQPEEEAAAPPPSNVSEDGRTPLHDAALNDDRGSILAALADGADINAADMDGAVALHSAAHNGALRALEVLLYASALVDVPDRHGNTPLMIAVTTSNGDPRLVAALLAAGADARYRNNFGWTPLRMAELLEYRRVVTLLSRDE